MKKIFCLMMCAVLLFSLAACGGDKESSADTVDLVDTSREEVV